MNSFVTFVSLFSLTLVGCSTETSVPSEILQGASKDEVIAWMGRPDQIQDFVLPDGPFFGPQESLANLVPPGAVIEEWVYEIGDEVLYIWFKGENNELRDHWHVLATARYPKDAVY